MNTRIWNGLTTHPAELVGEEPDTVEDESPLTPMEKRIEWICADWADANECDTYDAWSDIQLMISGAIQSLIYCTGRYEDQKALNDIREIAFENALDCIRRDRYEEDAA